MAGPTLQYEHFQIETDASGAPVELDSTRQGITYRAYDTRLRKTVALKIIHRELLADENNRKRFLNEARAAAALEHPNIARVIHLCPVEATDFYYAMELVDGETLEHLLQRAGPLPLGEALRLLRPLADALVALGNQRLVHRDIQPGNIIVTKDALGAPTVKLIDFGLAKSIGTQAGRLDVVQTAELRASSAFNLSPEQILGNVPVDARSDFYSLGITLWTAAAGEPPFVGSPFEVNEGHLHGELDWQALPELPEPVRRLFASLLAKNPNDRPADARALCTLWDEALHSLEGQTARLKPLPAETSPAASAPASKPAATSSIPPHIMPLPASLQGCSEPSPAATVAEDPAHGLVLIRRLPPEFGEPLRAELLQAAQASLDHPHASLLNVTSVQEDSIVSEWRRGVSAARLLALQRQNLPEETVRGWLMPAAQAVDWAQEKGVRRTHFGLGNWLVEFLELDSGETPLDRASRDAAAWGRTSVCLDPLAGFDAPLAMSASDPDQTLMHERGEVLTSGAQYLAAFARAVQELYGGANGHHDAPVAALSQQANELVLTAIQGKSGYESARDWTAAFLAAPQGAPRAAVAAPPAAAPAAKLTVAGASGKTARSATAAGPGTPASSPWAKPSARPLSSYLLLWILATTLLLLGGLYVGLKIGRSSAAPARAQSGPQGEGAEGAYAEIEMARKQLEDHKPAEARAALERARELASRNPTEAARLAPIFSDLEKGIAAADSASEPPGAAASRDEGEEKLLKATKEHPYENELGMKFVPVKVKTTTPRTVLVAQTETRVGDFEQYAHQKKGGAWDRQVGQGDDAPAVAVVPIDIKAYCRWLNEKYPPGGKWKYRLPTEREWCAAAGLDEIPPSNAPDAPFLWGKGAKAWPPPADAGNFGRPNKPEPQGTMATGRSAQSPLGLYDLIGNAAEWCIDTVDKRYVLRGGSYKSRDKTELNLAHRETSSISERVPWNGFRLVISDLAPFEWPPVNPADTLAGGPSRQPVVIQPQLPVNANGHVQNGAATQAVTGQVQSQAANLQNAAGGR